MDATVEYDSCQVPRGPSFSPEMNFFSLRNWFLQYDSGLVAFSAGVDSSVLAAAAHNALGGRAVAVTSTSPSFARSELDSAIKVAKEIGIELIVVTQDDLASKDYVANQVSRCYFCRSNLVQAIMPIVRQRRISICVDGTHAEDMKSPRPGVKAFREAGFRAPFVELGFTKEDIRAIARMLKLSNAEKPPEACLSSRIAYGQEIDENTLRQIEAAESFIRELVSARIIRVRTIGSRAIIELDPESIEKAKELSLGIERKLRSLGYMSVEIDPNGYSPGRMLELFVHDNE